MPEEIGSKGMRRRRQNGWNGWNRWKSKRDILISWLFPLRCPVCDRPVKPFGESVCLPCLYRLKYVKPPRCMRCGRHVEEGAEHCRDCGGRQAHFHSGRALYEYESAAGAIYRLKYKGRREYGDFFGKEIGKYLGSFIEDTKAEALVPIPLHPKRLRQRGYNQAQVIAEAISEYTGIPVVKDLLIRVKNTRPLKEQSPRERQNNLKKAFNVGRNDVKLKTIIVIDDIYTTGATMEEAARTLSAAGVERIYFITLAIGQGAGCDY